MWMLLQAIGSIALIVIPVVFAFWVYKKSRQIEQNLGLHYGCGSYIVAGFIYAPIILIIIFIGWLQG